MSVVIIGSGPAGVAAAHALSATGSPVTMLDAGVEIEPARMAIFEELAQREPRFWPAEVAQRARGAFAVSVRRTALKPAYGSLFPYAVDDPDLEVVNEHAETFPSLARGGLSNSWGASILPVRQADISDWPITLEELAPHYRAVLRFVPMAGERDELSAVLPLYSDSPGRLKRSIQTNALLSHMRRHAYALSSAGIRFGASRLAVTATLEGAHRCRYCGLCLHGCPYQSIYNSSHTLDTLVREARVVYRGGIYVDRLTHAEKLVTIHFHARARPHERGEFTASRVFVACGAISSTRLMLESIGRNQGMRKLKDSQYFMFPMFTPRASPVSVSTQGNTLAQAFLELEGIFTSGHTVHLQFYGYNDLMLSALAGRVPLGADRLERLLHPALGRIMIAQGYLHSADSPELTISIDQGAVRLIGDEANTDSWRVNAVVRRLAAHARHIGAAPLPGLLQLGAAGKSNHLGGSLPMQRVPGELQSDTLGRLPGWRRVHVVDAAVLPSVPATTVTLSVMANAHRIAAAARELAP